VAAKNAKEMAAWMEALVDETAACEAAALSVDE